MRKSTFGLIAVVIFCCATVGQAALDEVVDVTVSVDAPLVAGKYQVNVGATHTLSVFGQLKPGDVAPGNGILGWDVDVRVGDTTILQLLAASVDRSGWDNDSTSSSSGTPTAMLYA